MKWRNWLSALIGAWLVMAPWSLGVAHHTSVVWASVWIGAILCLVSVWAAFTVRVATWRTWQNWVALLCGFCFLVIPFMADYEELPYWATAGAGIVAMVLNLWTLMASPIDSPGESGPRSRA